ncbi:MAG: restriction endonuclease [Candidatus Rokubacteria bacterium]|nr:restriction endonuclease [Candidatus Rokubacteria bacterium]
MAIFPEGTPNRLYCVRDIGAATVFTMIYVGAIEGVGRYLGPKHVYRMTDRQAQRTTPADRLRYAAAAVKPGFRGIGRRWYADTTRESIRDETLREGLMAMGAAIARADIPTTSSRPRYALTSSFSSLFDPALDGAPLRQATAAWQAANLSPGALARVQLLRQGVAATTEGVLISFPNGETRRMAAGPSSAIAKAVIEDFAPRFLIQPGVIWLSESRNKVVTQDDVLAASVGLNIQPDRNLPDLILVDLGAIEPLLVFVETVATDGAITTTRQRALHAIASGSRFGSRQIVFVTAYRDRSRPEFKKPVAALAWDSFVWFVSEPTSIMSLRDGSARSLRLADLIR